MMTSPRRWANCDGRVPLPAKPLLRGLAGEAVRTERRAGPIGTAARGLPAGHQPIVDLVHEISDLQLELELGRPPRGDTMIATRRQTAGW